MTIEVVKFRCPLCEHQLGEIEYRQACEKNQKFLEQLSEEKSHSLKIEHLKEIQRLQENHNLEMKKEVEIKVQKQLEQENLRRELKHKRELAEKDNMIELVRQQGAEQQEEKIKQAINLNEAKHLQTEKVLELKIERYQTLIEKQQKTIDGMPPELRGTAGEFVLVELLQKEFQRDNFTTKKIGKSMADVIQTIVTEAGENIPTPIVYDVKTGDRVTKSDINKAKNYMSIHKTTWSIIVTKDIKNERYTEKREGILLVHPLIIIDIAQQIRHSLIETRILTKNNSGRVTKQSKLYDYFTSQEYTSLIREKIEWKLKYDNIDRKEETLRNQRNECVEKLVELDHKTDAVILDITQDTTEGDIEIQNRIELISTRNGKAASEEKDDVS